MNTAAAIEVAVIAPKCYRLNGKCKCGQFMSRAFNFVGKVDSKRSKLRDLDTGAEVIGYNVVKMKSNGAIARRWQVGHTCICGQEITLMPVIGTIVPEHKCGAKCLNSKGHTCECSCGGENHGKCA